MDINKLLYESAKRLEAAMVWVVTPLEKRADHAPWMGVELARLLDLGIVDRLLPDLIEAHERICEMGGVAQRILNAVHDPDGPGLVGRIGLMEERLDRIEEAIRRIYDATVDDSEPPWSSR